MLFRKMLWFLVPTAQALMNPPATTPSDVLGGISTASAAVLGPTMEAITSSFAMEMGTATAAAAAAATAANQEFGELQKKLEAFSTELQRSVQESKVAADTFSGTLSGDLQRSANDLQRSATESKLYYDASSAEFQKQMAANVAELQRQSVEKLLTPPRPDVVGAQAKIATSLESAKMSLAQLKGEWQAAYDASNARSAAVASEKFNDFAASVQDFIDACQRGIDNVGGDPVKLLFDARLLDDISATMRDLPVTQLPPLDSPITGAVALSAVAVASAASKNQRPIASKPDQYITTQGRRFLATDAASKKAFTAYCVQFNKVYKTDLEWRDHFQRWRLRLQKLGEYQSANPGSPRLALNAFADLPGDDLA